MAPPGGGEIPVREVERFLRALPQVRLFQDHRRRRVRAITLVEVYRAALAGVNHLVRLLHGHRGLEDHLLAICVDLETSLHPFLAENRHLRALVSELVRTLVAEIEDSPEALSPPSWDLYLLGTLQLALPQLPAGERRRPQRLLAGVRRRLREVPPRRYTAVESAPAARIGERDGSGEARWERWLHRVVEARYAHGLGAELDLDRFYARSASRIEAVPFSPDYALELFNVLTHIAYAMSFYNRIPLSGDPVADRLADHGLRYLAWLQERDLYARDPEILAGFVDAFLKGTCRAYDATPWWGSIVRLLLDTQHSDGGWGEATGVSAPGDLEPDALYAVYHPTWVCVDALRPLRNDVANVRNRRLGLR